MSTPSSILSESSAMEISVQLIAVIVGLLLIAALFVTAAPRAFLYLRGCLAHHVYPYLKFFYVSFFKPHSDVGSTSQQAALESFYKLQADAYDVTRASLLKGRENLLSILAAHLQAQSNELLNKKSRTGRIWVDIGGGTGYNIEAMSAYVSVPDFFSQVYLVDFSPSLCEVAKARFARLGWKNVRVICQDARLFRLEDYEYTSPIGGDVKNPKSMRHSTLVEQDNEPLLADLITMSYSLSMIPDFHSVVDSLSRLLSPTGIAGVVDFYVQSDIDVRGRNYVGGIAVRHVNWFSRAFWRAWFEADRVNLDSSRRDYLEYRFGTMLSTSDRNYRLGGIPFYCWIGCLKSARAASSVLKIASSADSQGGELLDTRISNPLGHEKEGFCASAKVLELAKLNMTVSLPLPSFFYQNRSWRIHYDDQLAKHTQFKDEYIYTFTWEDPIVDKEILKIGPDDEILAITSAGDNILSYALEKPRRIHAVDLNPAQNHLLELKLAAFASLGYEDVWNMFGEGYHPNFRSLLLSRLSPFLSSRCFQFWLEHTDSFTKSKGGLYATGGSRHALKLATWLIKLFGLTSDAMRMCESSSLEFQSSIWHSRLRKVLCSKAVNWAIVCHRKFLWKALGVPQNQRDMIVDDYAAQNGGLRRASEADIAIHRYMLDTLDPVIDNSLLAKDNYFYYLCLQGKYSQSCHPEYLSPKAYSSLSDPNITDRISIHTDELLEVISHMSPSTLTIVVIMDSMDWFDRGGVDAVKQIAMINRALKKSGRVLLRSASVSPWYIRDFEACGFDVVATGQRRSGNCIDRVNMYASCWVCTKVEESNTTLM